MADQSWEWGLLPDRNSGEPLTAKQVLHHWFVRYNPLYFFSAACVLAGVALAARGAADFGPEASGAAQLGLFAVVQLYEFLLIGACALLARRAGALRAAVLLALLEVVFLFDCTFRLESIADSGPLAPSLSLAWIGLTGAKAWALCAALRLELPRVALLALVAAACGIAGLPQLLTGSVSGNGVVLQLAGWYGACLLCLMSLARPQVACAFARSDWGHAVLARASRAAFWILAGFFYVHLWSYIVFVADRPVQAMFGQTSALALVAAFTARSEARTWLSCAAAIGLALFHPPIAAGTAMLAAGLLVLHAQRQGWRRLWVAAVFAVYAAVWWSGWKSGALPAPPPALSWQTIALVAALAWIAWYLCVPLAWWALGCVLASALWSLRQRIFPTSEFGWGVLLLALGFAALVGGVVVNWRWRARAPGHLR